MKYFDRTYACEIITKNEKHFEIGYSKDEMIESAMKYKSVFSEDSRYDFCISEISNNKIIFDNTMDQYNYFRRIINENDQTLYDKLLSIINSNKFYYKNDKLVSYRTCYNVPEKGEFSCNEENFSEYECSNGYTGKFEYLEPSSYEYKEHLEILTFPEFIFITCVKFRGEIFRVFSSICDDFDDAEEDINNFYYNFINEILGEDYTDKELEEFLTNNKCEITISFVNRNRVVFDSLEEFNNTFLYTPNDIEDMYCLLTKLVEYEIRTYDINLNYISSKFKFHKNTNEELIRSKLINEIGFINEKEDN